jgi:dTDP-D-glucose 4,6-dehydratase
MNQLGWEANLDLAIGIKYTYAWYLENWFNFIS